MDGGDYNPDGMMVEEPTMFSYQSCMNFLLVLLICATCPISLPILAACWCCQNFCLMGEMCMGEAMGEGAETALI